MILSNIYPTRDEVISNRRDKTKGIKLVILNEIYFSIKDLVDKKIDKLKYQIAKEVIEEFEEQEWTEGNVFVCDLSKWLEDKTNISEVE